MSVHKQGPIWVATFALALGLTGCPGCQDLGDLMSRVRISTSIEAGPKTITSFSYKPLLSSAPVDILFVVDNSVSMERIQNDLAFGFESFAKAYLSGSELSERDFRIGVIPTDYYYFHQFLKPVREVPKPGHFRLHKITKSCDNFKQAGERGNDSDTLTPTFSILNTRGAPDANSLVDSFRQWANVGVCGHPMESVSLSLAEFIRKNEMRSECFDGSNQSDCFFRDGSIRVLISVGNEHDQGHLLNLRRSQGGRTAIELSLVHPVSGVEVSIAEQEPSDLESSGQYIKKLLDGYFETIRPGIAGGHGSYFMIHVGDKADEFSPSLDQYLVTNRCGDGLLIDEDPLRRVRKADLKCFFNMRKIVELVHNDPSVPIEPSQVNRFSRVYDLSEPGVYSRMLEEMNRQILTVKTREIPVEVISLENRPSSNFSLTVGLRKKNGQWELIDPNSYIVSCSQSTITIADPAIKRRLEAGDTFEVQYVPASVDELESNCPAL